MHAMKKFKQELARRIAEAAGGRIEPAEVLSLLEAPPQPEMGDLAFPCFTLSKKLKQNPAKIAADLAGKLKAEAGASFKQIAAKGPYLNFFFDETALARETLTDIRAQTDHFGGSEEGQGQTVVIDYSSPNIAKPFHIGHLRSTVIGATLCRIYAALGFRPVGINHLGDWGTQFGMVMAAYSESPDEAELEEHPIRYSLKLYTEFNRRAEAEEAAREQARQWFRRLEAGDPEATALWQKFRELSLGEFQRIYQRLGIRFDHYMGESFYNDKMEDAITRVEKAGLMEKGEDGAELVRLEEEKMPPLLLRKSDGATLYATRDLAAAIFRWERYHPARILYVVGTPQELHFRQLIRVLEKMGCDWAQNLVHVKFGHVQGMSTRQGTAVFLEDVLDEAAARAREKIAENVKAGKLDPASATEELAEAIGIGALIAQDLKNRRERDVVFDWDQALNFDGETGPYLQYTHARICGILRKSGRPVPEKADYSLLAEPETLELLKALSRFPEAVEKAGAENEPSYIADNLFSITKNFNAFYNTNRVILIFDEQFKSFYRQVTGQDLKIDAPLVTTEQLIRKKQLQEVARLMLVDAVRQVLHNGLALLGIKPLEQM